MNDSKILERGAIALVNVFTAKPGQLDEFCDAQIAEYERLQGRVDGALGNRLYKQSGGRKAVNIAYFSSREKYDAWRASDLFKEHFSRIDKFLDNVEPDLFEVVYESE